MRPQDEWDGGAGAEPQPYVPPPHHWRDAEDQNIIVRVLRLAVPWVALIAVVTAVLTFWSEFRLVTGTGESPAAETTGTAGPATTSDAPGSEAETGGPAPHRVVPRLLSARTASL